MRKSKAAICVAVVVLGLSTVSLAAGDVTVGVGADFMSKYVWRGQNLVDNWVLQPSVSLGYKGLTGSIWGNSDMTGETVDNWEFTELDYTLDYSGTVPGVDVLGYSIGAIYYDFPNSGGAWHDGIVLGVQPGCPGQSVDYGVPRCRRG